MDLQPVLRGDLLELRPLRADDFDGLYAVAADPLVWEQHPVKNRHEEDAFGSFFRGQLESGGTLVAVDRADGSIVGSSRFHGYDEARSELEIGWTFLARSHWGGVYNGEMKRLMLQHAFRSVDSVVFLIDPQNVRSQRAVEKIGAVRVGTRLDAGGRESVAYRIGAAAFAADGGPREKVIVRRRRDPGIAELEFRLLDVLRSTGLPVPAPRGLSSSALVLGHVEGEPGPAVAHEPGFVDRFAAALVGVHRFDLLTADLSFLPVRVLVPRNRPVLLHGDFWPGNTLWQNGRLAVVVDWEDAATGDPLADVANARLELLWLLGADAMETFTACYASAMPHVDLAELPYWDLWADLRLAGRIAEWGLDAATEAAMRAGHEAFVAQALEDVSRVSEYNREHVPRKATVPPDDDLQHLRVLIANERRDRLELLAQVVIGLGHDVIAREIDVADVGAVTAREHPDVALVGLGLSSEHALDLISEIVLEASCPVIAILHASDPAYVREAAKRGVFAYIVDGSPPELQSAIDITLQRFTEYQSLQGAFGRRAVIEQAKGILMARHSIRADEAFERMRNHSQHGGRKLVDVAAAIVESHLLLLPPSPQAAGGGSD